MPAIRGSSPFGRRLFNGGLEGGGNGSAPFVFNTQNIPVRTGGSNPIAGTRRIHKIAKATTRDDQS
jgi:hypothetical protein